MDAIFLKKDFELTPFLEKYNLRQNSRIFFFFKTLHEINELGQRK